MVREVTMHEGRADELYEASKRLSRSEAQRADLMKVIQDDLSDLSWRYERHRSEMVFPKAAAAVCALLALRFYFFGEKSAVMPFGVFAVLAIIIGLMKADAMRNIQHRIFEIEERLIAREHGVEWTKDRPPVAKVISKLT
jgi:hypothetical protein